MNRSTLIALTSFVAILLLIASVALSAWLASARNGAPNTMDVQSFFALIGSSGRPASLAASNDSVPNIDLTTLPPYREDWGDTLRLHDYAGRIPLVVNVWASWCPPCRREALLLETAWQEHRDRVQFIGINLRDAEAAALEFVHEFGLTFPSGADPRGDAADAFGLVGVPTTYFIDASGRIDSTKIGEITEEDLALRIQALLPTQAPEPGGTGTKRSVEPS